MAKMLFWTVLLVLITAMKVFAQDHNTYSRGATPPDTLNTINTSGAILNSESNIATAAGVVQQSSTPVNTSVNMGASSTDAFSSYADGEASVPSGQRADRRTLGFLTGGGGGYGGGGGGYGGGGGGGGGGSGLVNFLTPLAGAAAAALTAGGGASLLSLPNANIQPTVQKTFVVNLGPHNPPLVVQGNAHQPGASAGQTINNQYGSGRGYRSGSSGGGGGGSGGGYRYPASKISSSGSYAAESSNGQSGSGGYVKYPNSPSFPQAAGKLGLGNVLSLAKQSGIMDNLLIGGPFTFFAPSDEAFTKLPKIFLTRASENPEMLKNLLLYHLVPDTITTRHFTNDLLLPTLNTKKVRINLYQLGYKKIATVNGAIITRPDQYIINGVIHVIDRVLFPVANGTILQVMNQPNCQPFDVISTVFAIAGLYDKLDENGPYTVFLPNTEAFGLIPAEERDKLIQNTTLIREAFLYHIVPGTYYSQGLSDGQWLDTLSTFGVPLQVGMVSDGYSRRFDSVNGAVRIVKADIPAENGVIHIVDKIITPFQTYLPCLNNN